MTLRILVASDLHANVDRGPKKNDTYVLTEPPPARPAHHPLGDLEFWLSRQEQPIDYVIVPGDISNQADSVGLEYAWSRLSEIAAEVGAVLIGAPGNHDVTTHQPSVDPRSALKSLDPSFPSGNSERDLHFWEKGWVLCDDQPSHRILVLDSTFCFPAYPTGVSKKTKAFRDYLSNLDRGSFPEEVEDELETIFSVASEKLNILVVHHHPVEHQNISHLRDGYGPMHRGGDLIDLLSRHPSMGRWMVIHGHKHIPQLVNAVSATANGPLVLCAASLGHRLWDPITTTVRNQFHIVEASNSPSTGLSSLRGKVTSYFWGYGAGWQHSPEVGCGLPGNAGFGCADDFRTLGNQILAHMQDPASPREILRIAELTAKFPQLDYQLPLDSKFLQDYLRQNGYEFSEHRGRRVQLGRIS